MTYGGLAYGWGAYGQSVMDGGSTPDPGPPVVPAIDDPIAVIIDHAPRAGVVDKRREAVIT